MVSTLSSVVLLAGHLSLALAAGFTGQGYIHVLQGAPESAVPSDKIGCMSASGALTLSDCGVFTRVEPSGISSPLGNCTFQDTTQPLNTDSLYGKGSHAWSCATGVDTSIDRFYTFVSAPGQAVCAFNLLCLH